MGVTGLLRILKPIGEERTLDDLQGLTLGVDGYGWLHRAVLTCAEDLVHNRPTTRYLEYIDRRVTQFERYGIKLYFVFDGAALPMKKRVELQRAAARESARAQMANGSGSGAHRAVNVTTEMAACVCAYLRAKKLPYIVAPYEADPQLVYLESKGLVDGILSEDSDLLIFGARRLFTKLESSGMCIEINIARLRSSPLAALATENQSALLRLLAVVSGCDYSTGINGIGPVKAAALVAKHRDLDTLVAAVTREGRVLETDFVETCRRADLAFQFQRVFDPTQRCLVTLTTLDSDTGLDDIIGPSQDPALAVKIARGVWCPETQRILAVPPHVLQFLNRISRQPLAVIQTNSKIERKVARVLGPRGQQVSPFFKVLAKPPPTPARVAPQLTPNTPLKENIPPSTPQTSTRTVAQSLATPIMAPPVSVPLTPYTPIARPESTESESRPPPKFDFKRFAYSPQ